MPSPPESTKSSLRLRLITHARDHWPQIGTIDTRFRSNFAYIAITLDDETAMPLMRLRYGGSANRWGFAIHLASTGKYEDSILPTGVFAGTPRKLSIAPAGSTSATPPHGYHPRRTNGRDH